MAPNVNCAPVELIRGNSTSFFFISILLLSMLLRAPKNKMFANLHSFNNIFFVSNLTLTVMTRMKF